MNSLDEYMPLIFAALMGLAFLIYAILDGYDLGVGILLPAYSTKKSKGSTNKNQHERETQADTMIASIGPFWDANETWLVMGVGILLIAFPNAHSLILYHLYLPTTLMLAGLILRGVAFDFRAKAADEHKSLWDKLFKTGSLIASLSQGYMLGAYVMGFQTNLSAILFSILSACCVTTAYAYIGASWLVMKTEGDLQIRAARLARRSGWITALGIFAVSIVNPMINPTIFERWFGTPAVILLLIIPAVCALLFIITDTYLKSFPYEKDFGCWLPFASAVAIFFLCAIGLAYSFYPFVVPNEMTFPQAASSPESLRFIFYGVVIVLPTIIAYTIFSYRVFWGKATQLKYY